ncbi:glycosyltransferase [Gemmobacter lutimaris]|uniref:Glycosyltransferase n=1 Tax=Gemmobacter lutimaris TaxID=2306023 RepID=A0A398BMB1_9RHOB|nr:glycosyltransferase [Gemmobacter lutimaris]RID89648.1 glycosyltransferase [Gemmobacter lutimaris]
MNNEVTIVIPVYNALEETIMCVQSLLESDAANSRIILNDDGSRAGNCAKLIKMFHDFENVEVRSNFQNRGYTANVQFGVDAADTKYVAVINSDTLFPAVWLAPIVSLLERSPYLAAVGPMSNAASYQNIPELKAPSGDFSKNEDFGREQIDREAINAFLQVMFSGIVIDAPILNGFCTVFRQRALKQIGGFSVQDFPTGYGEENDVCMRLMAAGYRLGITPQVFVHHLKSKSFGDVLKKDYSRNGRITLERLYGANFVPSFADVLERNGLLQNVRTLVSGAISTPRSHKVTELREAQWMPLNKSMDPQILRVKGPMTALIWEDLVETVAIQGPDMVQLSYGEHHLRVDLPDGAEVCICTSDPLTSAFCHIANQSFFDGVRLIENIELSPASTLSPLADKLRFGNLFANGQHS